MLVAWSAVSRYSLSAVGRDRPGIVAAVTGALADHGCNLQDSTMATLQGQFAMVLIVSAPDDVDSAAIEADLDSVAQRLDLVVALRALHEDGAPSSPAPGGASDSGTSGSAWMIAVHGADRPGIVHAITAALADAGGNIVDLATHLVGPPSDPVYTLAIRATLPRGSTDRSLDPLLQAAEAFGVHCTVHPDDADVL